MATRAYSADRSLTSCAVARAGESHSRCRRDRRLSSLRQLHAKSRRNRSERLRRPSRIKPDAKKAKAALRAGNSQPSENKTGTRPTPPTRTPPTWLPPTASIPAPRNCQEPSGANQNGRRRARRDFRPPGRCAQGIAERELSGSAKPGRARAACRNWPSPRRARFPRQPWLNWRRAAPRVSTGHHNFDYRGDTQGAYEELGAPVRRGGRLRRGPALAPGAFPV